MVRVNHFIYTKCSHLYDDKEKDREYVWEVRDIKDRIKEAKKSKGKELLDVGCGTGTHLKYLQDDFNCTGLDLHKKMIDIAKKKLKKKVILLQANMVDFNLNKQFDIIISLYSVINYAKDIKQFRKILKNFYKHIKKGGVCIIEPYFTLQIYRHDRKKPYPKGLLPHDIKKWSKVMREEGFKVKYFYSGLNQKAKGLYVLTK